MKDVRFYEEFSNKRKGISAGTVIAVLTDWDIASGMYDKNGRIYEAIGALFDEPNSSVASTSVHENYLRENCKRVSQKRALEIHPRLIEGIS